jgi:hypothetical protein
MTREVDDAHRITGVQCAPKRSEYLEAHADSSVSW